MRILLLCHAFNSLTQRLHVELMSAGHEVSVEFDINDAVTAEAVALFAPDLVVAPFLKRAIPAAVWGALPCLVVHPGIPGDGGPTALDHAILDGVAEWGVTVLEATGELDAGPVWAAEPFAMRLAPKSSLYRHEVTEAAVTAVMTAVAHYERHGARPEAPLGPAFAMRGHFRPAVRQAERTIDWAFDDTLTVLRKIHSADGQPGLRASIGGEILFLHDAHPAAGLSGAPSTAIARSGEAIAVATADGAVWIGHLRDAAPGAIKLPAARVLPGFAELPEVGRDDPRAFSPVRVSVEHGVAHVDFAFYNGAMSVAATRSLIAAFEDACRRARVVVLAGGPDHWSNGMDLNRIEAAPSPADESWANINALDDLAEAIIRADDRLVIAALAGNAGAGGVYLARAADRVWIRDGAILNPHYKDMGNLPGSELWTYLLPAAAGPEMARRIMARRLPTGAAAAVAARLADERLPGRPADFVAEVRRKAAALAADPALDRLISEKAARRAADEAQKPLARYREEELALMRRSFYGFDQSYHVARSNFVRKVPKSRTPLTLARHRAIAPAAGARRASA